MRIASRWIIVIALILAVATACMGEDESTESTPEATSLPASTETTATTATSSSEPTEPVATATTQQTEAPTATLTPIPSGVPLDELQVDLELVVDGLDQPTGIVTANDGSGRLFIIERTGRIRILQDGQLLETPFLDISDQVTTSGPEQGLLGLAFHPDYETNGTFYVNYTNPDGDTRISRFQVTDDPNQADAGSEINLFAIDQPATNHNGGELEFGPDGMLWIGLGDGGGGGDTYGNGQNGQTLLATILRVDPSTFADPEGTPPYEIPPDNPYVDDPDVLDEIWAIGLRNPWRFRFDRETGDLYIADVGQNQWEEINVVPAGSPGGLNFGWPIMEGTHCYSEEDCDTSGLTLPVFEYSHDEGGCSVTGGEVYRGTAQPDLVSTYFFADYCSGKLWGMQWAPDGGTQTALLNQFTEERFSSFGHDAQGELYLTSLNGGIFHLVAR